MLEHAMSDLLTILMDAILYSSWLFTIAIGLTLIYGVMKILNMAHGSLYALGAYTAATFVGYWLSHGYAPLGSYGIMALAAIIIGLVMGPLIERGLLRFLYGKDEILLLIVTFGLFLILEDVIKLIWGVDSYFVSEPYVLLGSFDFAGWSYPVYNIIIVGVALAAGIGMLWVLKYTRQGKLLLAVIHNREISLAMGIKVDRFYLMTFTVGVMLAAIGGVVTAPTVSMVPGMGVEVIILAFAVAVIGGLGSFQGAALGSLIVGLVRSLAVRYLPELELFSIYIVMALVLLFKPQGLFSSTEARKI
jgi:branched-chain amino acid transport system permease protein